MLDDLLGHLGVGGCLVDVARADALFLDQVGDRVQLFAEVANVLVVEDAGRLAGCRGLGEASPDLDRLGVGALQHAAHGHDRIHRLFAELGVYQQLDNGVVTALDLPHEALLSLQV